MKEIQKVVQKLSREQSLRPAAAQAAAQAAAAYEPVQKHKVTPVYRGDLNIKHGCTFVDLRHFGVMDSLLFVFICT